MLMLWYNLSEGVECVAKKRKNSYVETKAEDLTIHDLSTEELYRIRDVKAIKSIINSEISDRKNGLIFCPADHTIFVYNGSHVVSNVERTKTIPLRTSNLNIYHLEVDVLNIQGHHFYATYCGNIPKDQYLLARLLPVEILHNPNGREWVDKVMSYAIYDKKYNTKLRKRYLRNLVAYHVYSKCEVQYLISQFIKAFPNNPFLEADKQFVSNFLSLSQSNNDLFNKSKLLKGVVRDVPIEESYICTPPLDEQFKQLDEIIVKYCKQCITKGENDSYLLGHLTRQIKFVVEHMTNNKNISPLLTKNDVDFIVTSMYKIYINEHHKSSEQSVNHLKQTMQDLVNIYTYNKATKDDQGNIIKQAENKECLNAAKEQKKDEKSPNSPINDIISFDPCTDIIYVIPVPQKNTVPNEMVNMLNKGRRKIKVNVLADKNRTAYISFYYHQEKNIYIIHEYTLLKYMGDYGYLILKFCHLSDMDDDFGIKYEYLYLQSKDYRRRFLCNLIDLQLYSIQHIIEVLEKLLDSGTVSVSQNALLSDIEFLHSYKPRYISYQKTVQQLVSKPIRREDDKLIMEKSLSIMQNITSSQDKSKLLSEMFDKLYDNIVINTVKGLSHTQCVQEYLLTETSIQNQDMSEFFYGYLLPHITQQIKVIATILTMNDGINELLTIEDVRFVIISIRKYDDGIIFQGVNSLKKAVRTVVAKYQANREIKLQKNQQPRQIPFNPEQLHTVYLYSHKNALKENEYEMVNVLVRCANSQDVVPITVYYSKAQNKYFLNSACFWSRRIFYNFVFITLWFSRIIINYFQFFNWNNLNIA